MRSQRQSSGRSAMRMSSVPETIAAIGYAKVIVAFKPAPPAAPAEPAAAAIEALRGVRSRIRARLPLIDRAALESALGQHFIIPNQSQVEHLAASAVRAASKRFKRAEPLESRRVRV